MEQTMIPYIECMTTSMVADYYGIPKSVVKNRYAQHKEEFDKIGVMTINSKEFEELLPKNAEYVKTPDRCMVNYKFGNGLTVSLHTNKNQVFTKEAVEYMKSVLQPSTRGGIRHREKKVVEDNNIAEDTKEKDGVTKPKKNDFHSSEEQRLCLSLAKAYATGDTMKVLNAALALDTYRIKVIDELREENNRLAEESDKRISWTERRSAPRIVKILSEILEQRQNDIWNSIYCKLTINYHLPLEERRKLPLIDAVERSEWFLVYQAIIEVCEDRYLDVRRVFDKAEINTAGLERIVKGKLI